MLLLAATMLFAFTVSAFANTASGYIDWSTVKNNPENGGLSPHAGYTLTSTKCLVCHAAHKASATGEILLATTASQACTYCHIDAGPSVKKVYGGGTYDPNNVSTGSNKVHNVSCVQCHAVHGANTYASGQMILRKNAGGFSAQAGLPTAWTTDTAYTDGTMTAFCTNCHPYWTDQYATGAGAIEDPWDMVTTKFSAHVMKAAGTYTNAKASYKNATVAWAGSEYCVSCHDDGNNTATNSFPHATTGARFMKAASSVGAADVTAATASNIDGVCLKCHVSGTAGVGKSF